MPVGVMVGEIQEGDVSHLIVLGQQVQEFLEISRGISASLDNMLVTDHTCNAYAPAEIKRPWHGLGFQRHQSQDFDARSRPLHVLQIQGCS